MLCSCVRKLVTACGSVWCKVKR